MKITPGILLLVLLFSLVNGFTATASSKYREPAIASSGNTSIFTFDRKSSSAPTNNQTFLIAQVSRTSISSRNIADNFSFTPDPVKKGARIAITDFSIDTDVKGGISGKTVQLNLEEILADDSDYRIISRAQIKRVYDETIFQSDGLLDKAKAIKFQQKTLAEYLLTGSICQMGERLYVVANLIDLNTHRIVRSARSETFFPNEYRYNMLQEIAMMLKMRNVDKKRMREKITNQVRKEKVSIDAKLAKKARQGRIEAQKRRQQSLIDEERRRVVATLPAKRKRLTELSREMTTIADALGKEYKKQVKSLQRTYNRYRGSIAGDQRWIDVYYKKIQEASRPSKIAQYKEKIRKRNQEIRDEEKNIDRIRSQVVNSQQGKHLREQFRTLKQEAYGIIKEIRDAGVNDALPVIPREPDAPQFIEPDNPGRGYM